MNNYPGLFGQPSLPPGGGIPPWQQQQIGPVPQQQIPVPVPNASIPQQQQQMPVRAIGIEGAADIPKYDDHPMIDKYMTMFLGPKSETV